MVTNTSSTIAESLQFAHCKIEQAAQKAQRNTREIRLLAVSKTKPLDRIQAAYDAGQRAFGENYVQEGVDKIQQLQGLSDIEWHFIGPLQSNKTRLVAEHFDWCQTVERTKIAQRLHDQRPVALAPLKVCIQINIDQETTKSGVLLADVMDLADTIAKLDRLQLRGIMAIPSASSDIQQQQQSYSKLQDIFQQLTLKFPSVDTLSLGMSADLVAAIAHGSTMVRLGTAIFGAREKK